jgi:hypothetical protein
LQNNAVNAVLLDEFANVSSWMERMAAFGHAEVTESTPEAALAAGSQADPVCPPIDSSPPEGFALGAPVQVVPVDYGRIAVSGELTAWSHDEIVLTREDDQAGTIMVHFPSAGFEVTKG